MIEHHESPDDFSIIIKGEATKALPEGTFNYKGLGKFKAGDNTILGGDVSYDVDFGAKTGSGAITGLSGQKDIILETDKIVDYSYDENPDGETIKIHGFEGTANNGQKGTYHIGFFGPKAEEIVGEVEFGDDDKSLRGVFSATKQ